MTTNSARHTERTSVMKLTEFVLTRRLIIAALCLTAWIAPSGRGEEPQATGKPADSSVMRVAPDGPAFLRSDKTQKPIGEGVGHPKEVTQGHDLTRSVYKPDSALPYQDPPASATGSSTAAPKRTPALAGGINIEGSVFYSLGATTGYFTADRVANHRPSGTSGTLRLELWATMSPPGSGTVFGYQLAIDSLGTLPAGYNFSNINSGTFTYTQPPAGCYYMSLLLTEFDGTGYPYIDYALFSNLVTFRGGSCVACTEDAYTMCLVNGRYRVTSHWRNQYAGGATANLLKAKLTDTTGAFWIADANTYEYLIRFNTATNNGRIWIAIPTFTDVEFWVDVTDTAGAHQSFSYYHPPSSFLLIYDPFFFIYP
jgi:hypothetical protein